MMELLEGDKLAVAFLHQGITTSSALSSQWVERVLNPTTRNGTVSGPVGNRINGTVDAIV